MDHLQNEGSLCDPTRLGMNFGDYSISIPLVSIQFFEPIKFPAVRRSFPMTQDRSASTGVVVSSRFVAVQTHSRFQTQDGRAEESRCKKVACVGGTAIWKPSSPVYPPRATCTFMPSSGTNALSGRMTTHADRRMSEPTGGPPPRDLVERAVLDRPSFERSLVFHSANRASNHALAAFVTT